MEIVTRQLWLFLAFVPGIAFIVLVRLYLKANRQYELTIALDDLTDDSMSMPRESSSELRRAITAEAIALIASRLAATKDRRQPIPFPASAVVAQAAASFDPMHSFDAVRSSEVNSVNIPSVNTTNGAVEPQIKSASSTTPAAPATANAHPRRNWAELLARHSRPGGSAAPLQTAAPKAVDQATDFSAKASAPSPIQAPSLQTSRIQTPPIPNRPLAEIPLPAGIHDGYVLSRLVQSRRPISGLVVSIGIGTSREQAEAERTEGIYRDGEARLEPISKDVRQLVESLLGPHDFACASAPDEYLLIFPEDRGAAAQRKLSHIAQKLWDFQLQMLGRASILFSWGGVEVRGESIDEAVASASDRMQETRRTRSTRFLEKHGLRIAG